MCGIFGTISYKGLNESLKQKTIAVLRHRGPDDEGSERFDLKSGATLDLLHVRLSIIDLSEKAVQPMSYADGSLWIVYNGEVFNYRELRGELKTKGYEFETTSDTEVVLAAYQEWGTSCSEHFNGDWAFCIYDRANELLFFSRDRLGVKPLYYFQNGGELAFASELKALFNLPLVPRVFDIDVVATFILLGICDFSEFTMYKNIYQLEPATNMIYNLRSGTLEKRKYWEPDFDRSQGEYDPRMEKSYRGNIRDLLEDAVRLRLRADVAVGTCLSGGIDSSTIAALISGLVKKQCSDAGSVGAIQKTFTAAYRGDALDEERWARIIIAFTGAQGSFVYPQAADLEQDLEDLLGSHDEPVISTSSYAHFRVLQLAANQVTVVLDGQGADELFGGYSWHRELYCPPVYNPKTMLRILKRNVFAGLPGVLKKAAFAMAYRKKLALLEQIADNRINLDYVAGVLEKKHPASLNQALYQEETRYNLRQLLRYEDINSMRFGIEARMPFTDYRLVEYAFTVPACYKIHNGWTKYILRKAIEDLLPHDIVWRRDKIGFHTPEKKWLSQINSFREFLCNFGVTNYQGEFFWWRLFNFLELSEPS